MEPDDDVIDEGSDGIAAKKKKKKKKKGGGAAAAAAAADSEASADAAPEGADEGDDADDDDAEPSSEGGESAVKKKKKKKKKSGGGGGGVGVVAKCRGVKGFCDSFKRYGQTTPEPSIPVAELFKGKEFPKGEEMVHGNSPSHTPKPVDNAFRTTSEELKALERASEDLYSTVRHASEVHRQVRRWAQSWIEPGIKLSDMCERIEEKNRQLVQESGLNAGIGFPTGCSLNHVAAHYTPNCGDDTVLKYGDVMKIDFGTQIDGRIIDCAWTVRPPLARPPGRRAAAVLSLLLCWCLRAWALSCECAQRFNNDADPYAATPNMACNPLPAGTLRRAVRQAR